MESKVHFFIHWNQPLDHIQVNVKIKLSYEYHEVI